MPDNTSSASVVSEAPEQALDYNTYYRNLMTQWHPNWSASQIPDYGSISYRIGKMFSKDQNNAEQMYQTYLDNLRSRNEAKATQSARAFDEYMQSTAYQRTFKDLQTAGLNPYMLVGNASLSPTYSGNSARSSYGARNTGLPEKKQSDSGRNVALVLLALAKLLAM